MTTSTDANGVDLDIRDAVDGYARFRQRFDADRDFYRRLANEPQKPKILWIGCADSRVVPSQILSAEPGELFEIRNIANVVPPSSSGENSVGAAIEYAVLHLNIDDIVVCGHTGCGGIKALIEPMAFDHEPHLYRWIDYTRPAHSLIAAARVPDADRLTETIKSHVQFQIDNLLTYPLVYDRVATGAVAIHGWIYDMEHGEVLAYDSDTGDWLSLLELLTAA